MAETGRGSASAAASRGGSGASSSAAASPDLPAQLNPDSWIGQGVDAVMRECRTRAQRGNFLWKKGRSVKVQEILQAIDDLWAEEEASRLEAKFAHRISPFDERCLWDSALNTVAEYVNAKRKKHHFEWLTAYLEQRKKTSPVGDRSGKQIADDIIRVGILNERMVPANRLAVSFRNNRIVIDDASLVMRDALYPPCSYPPLLWNALCEVGKLDANTAKEIEVTASSINARMCPSIPNKNRKLRTYSPIFAALCRGDFSTADTLLHFGAKLHLEKPTACDIQLLGEVLLCLFQYRNAPVAIDDEVAQREQRLIRDRFRTVIMYLIEKGCDTETKGCAFPDVMAQSENVLQELLAGLSSNLRRGHFVFVDLLDLDGESSTDVLELIEDLSWCINAFKLDINAFARPRPENATLATLVGTHQSAIIELMKAGALCPTTFGGEVNLAALAADGQSIHHNVTARRMKQLTTFATSALAEAEAKGTSKSSTSSSSTALATGADSQVEATGELGLPTKQRRIDSASAASSSKIVPTVDEVLRALRERLRKLQDSEVRKLRDGERYCENMTNAEITTGIEVQIRRFCGNEGETLLGNGHQPKNNRGNALLLVYRYLHAFCHAEDPIMMIFGALLQAQNQYGPNMQTCDPKVLVLNLLEGRVVVPDPADAEQVPSGPDTYAKTLKELQTRNVDQIISEGQARLATLNESELLQQIYDLIVSGESLDYAKNRLRGLFFTQLLTDCDHDLAKYTIDLEDDEEPLGFVPDGVQRLLRDVGEISCIFTEEFLKASQMQAAFAPFLCEGEKQKPVYVAAKAGANA
ncbi:unnamed protein product [Amoebophrya sp. A120]|nr:unnamed protein product [Amoebophrya sp. A120]|eukprot:GSA120T00003672001.1